MNYCVNGMLTMLCDEIVYVCLVISMDEVGNMLENIWSVQCTKLEKKMKKNKF